jgi:hypothetical protein
MRKYFRGRESAAEVNSAMKSILIKILGADLIPPLVPTTNWQ